MNVQEERLVAKLETLGVRYLSRQAKVPIRSIHSLPRFLADLVRQPSSRVRTALIALLLAQPQLAADAPAAAARLKPADQLTLKLLYTAAVILQQKYAGRLQLFLGERWQTLPDLYAAELGLEATSLPDKRLHLLGEIHRQRTGVVLNWAGTYENAAYHLLRRWEMEEHWSQRLLVQRA